MAFLQQRFCNTTKFQVKSLKSESGFLIFSLLSFLSLMFLVLIGFSLLSLGIKKSTQSQSYCLRTLSQTQQHLGKNLQQLLNLNHKVRALDKIRKSIDQAIAVATASIVLIPTVPNLKQMRNVVQLSQKALVLVQQRILVESHITKVKQINQLKLKLKKLKAHVNTEHSIYKKSLAVEKEKIGDHAYIYQPVENFTSQQKIKLSWSLHAFDPLEKDLNWLFDSHEFLSLRAFSIQQHCAVTLKQEGDQWVYHLTH